MDRLPEGCDGDSWESDPFCSRSDRDCGRLFHFHVHLVLFRQLRKAPDERHSKPNDCEKARDMPVLEVDSRKAVADSRGKVQRVPVVVGRILSRNNRSGRHTEVGDDHRVI